MARQYLSIRLWGAPAAISIYALTGWLIAMERTRGVLLLQFWMNGLNIILDVWFVLSLGWGVAGVASATIIAEYTAVMLGLYLARQAFSGSQWRNWGRVLDPVRLRRMIEVNGNILIRTLLLQTIMLSFMFVGAGMGDRTLAANQILMQFLSITAFALDGFAFAAEAMVGNALGAKAIAELRRAAWLSTQWAFGVSLLLGATFAIFGGALIDAMTTAESVRIAARAYLPWVALAPVIGVFSWMLDGIFIGATKTREMRNAMLQSAVMFAVIAWGFVWAFGNHGLWAALLVSYVLRTLTLWRYYPRIEAEALA